MIRVDGIDFLHKFWTKRLIIDNVCLRMIWWKGFWCLVWEIRMIFLKRILRVNRWAQVRSRFVSHKWMFLFIWGRLMTLHKEGWLYHLKGWLMTLQEKYDVKMKSRSSFSSKGWRVFGWFFDGCFDLEDLGHVFGMISCDMDICLLQWGWMDMKLSGLWYRKGSNNDNNWFSKVKMKVWFRKFEEKMDGALTYFWKENMDYGRAGPKDHNGIFSSFKQVNLQIAPIHRWNSTKSRQRL